SLEEINTFNDSIRFTEPGSGQVIISGPVTKSYAIEIDPAVCESAGDITREIQLYDASESTVASAMVNIHCAPDISANVQASDNSKAEIVYQGAAGTDYFVRFTGANG